MREVTYWLVGVYEPYARKETWRLQSIQLVDWDRWFVLPYKVPVRIVSSGPGNTQDGIIHKCHGAVQLSMGAPIFFFKSRWGKVSTHGLIMNYNTCSIQKIECYNFPLASRRVRQSSDHTTPSMRHPWHATTCDYFLWKGSERGQSLVGKTEMPLYMIYCTLYMHILHYKWQHKHLHVPSNLDIYI